MGGYVAGHQVDEDCNAIAIRGIPRARGRMPGARELHPRSRAQAALPGAGAPVALARRASRKAAPGRDVGCRQAVLTSLNSVAEMSQLDCGETGARYRCQMLFTR